MILINFTFRFFENFVKSLQKLQSGWQVKKCQQSNIWVRGYWPNKQIPTQDAEFNNIFQPV